MRKALYSIVFSSILVSIGQAQAATSYTCLGLSSNGEKLNSTLTLTPTDKTNVYSSLWTYTTPGSIPDKGVVSVVGPNRMVEVADDSKGVEKGQSDLFQVSDKQIVVSYESLSSMNKHKNLGICTLVE